MKIIYTYPLEEAKLAATALLPYTSKDEALILINNARIRPDGWAATNRYELGIVELTAAGTVPELAEDLLPRPALEFVSKIQPNKLRLRSPNIEKLLSLEFDDDAQTVTVRVHYSAELGEDHARTFNLTAHGSKFPPVEKLFPTTKEPSEVFALSMERLAALAHVAKVYKAEGPLQFEFNGEKAVEVKIGPFRGLAMPVRR